MNYITRKYFSTEKYCLLKQSILQPTKNNKIILYTTRFLFSLLRHLCSLVDERPSAGRNQLCFHTWLSTFSYHTVPLDFAWAIMLPTFNAISYSIPRKYILRFSFWTNQITLNNSLYIYIIHTIYTYLFFR